MEGKKACLMVRLIKIKVQAFTEALGCAAAFKFPIGGMSHSVNEMDLKHLQFIEKVEMLK